MNTKLKTKGLNFFYGKDPALKNINLQINERQITALIGPSGCGKSTFLRTLNRMNDIIPGVRIEGKVLLDDSNISTRESMSSSCASAWAWCSSSPIRSPNRYTRM